MLQSNRTGNRAARLAIGAQYPPSPASPKRSPTPCSCATHFNSGLYLSTYHQPQLSPGINQHRESFPSIPLQSVVSPAFVHRNPSRPRNGSSDQIPASPRRLRQQKALPAWYIQAGSALSRAVSHRTQAVLNGRKHPASSARNNTAIAIIEVCAGIIHNDAIIVDTRTLAAWFTATQSSPASESSPRHRTARAGDATPPAWPPQEPRRSWPRGA